MQSNTTAIALTTFNGEPRADSRAIAGQLGVEHESARKILKQYRADFEQLGILRFEIGEIKGRGQPEKFALLNEDQAYLLLTYSQNTPQARALKIRLVRAFGDYRRGAATPCAVERPLTAALRTNINRHAWRLAQESFETYRTAMLDAARFDPAFKPEQWNPVECLPMPQPEPPDLADMARQLALQSSYRSRNPQRDYEVLQLRLDGMNYREIGLEVGISGTHAWRIVQRQLGNVGAL